MVKAMHLQFSKRSGVYRSRKSGGDKVKVYLDLTTQRLNLLDKARGKITPDCNVEFVFNEQEQEPQRCG